MISELNNSGKEWSEFLKSNEHSIVHTIEFKEFIEKTFSNCLPCYLLLKNDARNKTLFPLFYTKHPLFGKRLISVSFNDFGAPSGDFNKQDLASLLDYARTKFKSCDIIEIREKNEANFRHYADFIKDDQFALYILKLSSEKQLWEQMDRKRRNSIRKGQGTVKVRDIHITEINDLYRIYLQNMKEFGTPPFPKEFFKNFFEIFVAKAMGKVLGAYVNGKLVCCLMAYTYNKRVDSIIGVSDYRYLDYKVNDVAYWDFIRWACNNGFEEFSFGRSEKNSGHAKFKLKWGCKEYPLAYFFRSFSGKPIQNLDKNSVKFRFLIACWKLLPDFMTKIIGPWIRKGLGI